MFYFISEKHTKLTSQVNKFILTYLYDLILIYQLVDTHPCKFVF